MRNTKKAISILLTLLMVVGMMSTFAFADTSSNGSIEIKNDTTDVTDDYVAYQILKGNIEEVQKGNNKISGITWGNAINWNSNKITILGTEYSNTVEDAVKFAVSVKTYTYDSSDSVKLATALNSIVKDTAKITLSNNNNIEQGYYLIKQSNPSNNQTATRFMLKVKSSGVTEVNVKEKQTVAPTPDKKIIEGTNEVEVSSAQIGENKEFAISAKLPASSTYDGYTSYSIKLVDTLPNGMTYDSTTGIKVYVVKANNTKEKISSDKYSFKAPEDNAPGGTIEISINTVGIAAAGETIRAEYKAALNASASIGNSGNINEMYVEYPQLPEGNNTVKTDKKTATVYTGKIIIDKYDGKDTKLKLDGAVFVVKNSEGKYLKQNSTNKNIEDWVSVTASEGEKLEDVLYNNDDVTKFTTANKTGVVIEGLKAGRYTLIEIKAPENYNLPSGDGTEITIGLDGDNLSNLKFEQTANVANFSGTELPETGGIGTTIFYLIGAILVIGAGVVFVTRRRMHSDK